MAKASHVELFHVGRAVIDFAQPWPEFDLAVPDDKRGVVVAYVRRDNPDLTAALHERFGNVVVIEVIRDNAGWYGYPPAR